MADRKISQLANNSLLSGQEYLPIVQPPDDPRGNKKIRIVDIMELAPVQSVNGSIGDIIITAVGLGALISGSNISSLTNDVGYITNITSLMVTSALGFTPVSSVSLAAPSSLFVVTGSPINGGSGTLTLNLANQSANKIFAGPVSGSAAAPDFRSMVSADIPNGIVTVSKLSASGTPSATNFLRGDGVWSSYAAVNGITLSGTTFSLGGTLANDVAIDGLKIFNIGSITPLDKFNITATNGYSIKNSSGAGMYFDPTGSLLGFVDLAIYAPGTTNFSIITGDVTGINEEANIQMSGGKIYMTAGASSGTLNFSLKFDFNPSTVASNGGVCLFTDGRGVGFRRGVEYGDDLFQYGELTDRSFIDLGAFNRRGVKPSAKAATTANITLSAPQTIDGVSLIANDICFVKNQTTASQNGLYLVKAGAWTRIPELNSNSDAEQGIIVAVKSGTANANTLWHCTNVGVIVLGTTALTFAQLGGSPLVSSVFGRTGAVVAATNDYTFAQIGSKPTTLSGYGITDAVPSSRTVNGVALSGNISVTDANLVTTNVTTNNASITKHGFVPILPNDITKFFNGVGGYTTPKLVSQSLTASQTFIDATVGTEQVYWGNNVNFGLWSVTTGDGINVSNQQITPNNFFAQVQDSTKYSNYNITSDGVTLQTAFLSGTFSVGDATAFTFFNTDSNGSAMFSKISAITTATTASAGNGDVGLYFDVVESNSSLRILELTANSAVGSYIRVQRPLVIKDYITAFLPPASGVPYSLVYDTTTSAVKVSNGTSWVTVGSGTITGSGTAGRMTFWTGTSVISSSASLLWDNTNAILSSSRFHTSLSSDPVGSVSDGDLIYNSTALDFRARVNGNWTNITRPEIEDVGGTAYAFTEADRGKIKRFTSVTGCTANFPNGLSLGWSVTAYRTGTAGTITFTASTTLESLGASLATAKTSASFFHTGSNVIVGLGALSSFGSLSVAGASTEIQTNNGSGNLGSGKIFIPSAGNMNIGDGTVAGDRIINASSSSSNYNFAMNFSGLGSFQILSLNWANGISITGTNIGANTLTQYGVSSGDFTVKARQGDSTNNNGNNIVINGGGGYTVVGNGDGGNVSIQSGAKRSAGSGSDGSVTIDSLTSNVFIKSGSNVILGTGTGGVDGGPYLALIKRINNFPAFSTGSVALWSQDSSDSTGTLAIQAQQAVEAIGTFTPSNKFKIRINGVEYWIQLDAV